ERNRVFGDAGNAEIVAGAADAENERVVGKHALREHFSVVVVVDRAQRELPALAVQRLDRTLPETEVMPMRQGEVVDAVRVGIHAPRRDFVQQGLPHVRLGTIDQDDLGATALPQFVAERAREPQATRATAGDNDAVLPWL